jgi:hypothetical protein
MRNPAQWVRGTTCFAAVSPWKETKPIPGATRGGWRRNGRKIRSHEARRPGWVRTAFMQPQPVGPRARKNRQPGVRAFIVARKRGNAREAKGRRKMDESATQRTSTRSHCHRTCPRLAPSGLRQAHMTSLEVGVASSRMLTVRGRMRGPSLDRSVAGSLSRPRARLVNP